MKLRIVFVTLVLGFGLALVLLWTLGDQKSSAVAAPLAPESEGDWDGLSVAHAGGHLEHRPVPHVVPGHGSQLCRLGICFGIC